MKILLYVILFICLVGCGESNTTSDTLQPSQSFRFDLSKNVTSYSNDSYQLMDDTNTLAGFNMKREEINFYSLEKGQLIKSITYGEEQKNIYDVHNFFIINEDSILLNSPHTNSFFLIDREGEKIKTIELDVTVPTDHQYKYFTLFSTAIFSEFNIPFSYNKKNNDIIIPFMYNNTYTLDEDIAYRYPPVAVVSLSEVPQEIRFIGEFPASFQEDFVPYDINNTIDVSINDKVINFPYSAKVYFESKNDFVSIKSAYDKQNFTKFKIGVDPTTAQYMDALAGDFMYLYTIIHPNDNGKLIRLCKHEQNIYKEDGKRLNNFFDAQWSLMMYDLDKQTVLKEYLLPKEVYDFKHFIPYKEGVLLVKNDNYKLLEDEEFLLLDYFKLF